MTITSTAFVGSFPCSFFGTNSKTSRIELLRPNAFQSPKRRIRVPFQLCAQNNTTNGTGDRKNIPRELKPEVKELRSVLKKCSIYLIGPMGSGKSVLAKYLAYEIGFRFLDTDELIEQIAKKSIAEIFKQDGESKFRDIESAVLDQIQAFIGCCVATGGGAVIKQENWGRLQTGIVVYLNTPIEVLVDRLKEDKSRPLLANAENLNDRIENILNDRKHLYEQADVIVPIEADDAVDEIGKELIRRLTNFIKANPPRLASLYPGDLPKKK